MPGGAAPTDVPVVAPAGAVPHRLPVARFSESCSRVTVSSVIAGTSRRAPGGRADDNASASLAGGAPARGGSARCRVTSETGERQCGRNQCKPRVICDWRQSSLLRCPQRVRVPDPPSAPLRSVDHCVRPRDRRCTGAQSGPPTWGRSISSACTGRIDWWSISLRQRLTIRIPGPAHSTCTSPAATRYGPTRCDAVPFGHNLRSAC